MNMVQKNLTLAPGSWREYELLDSGDGRKLERFGAFVLARPETQAIWRCAYPELWARADAEFFFSGGKGAWKKRNKNLPDSGAWEMKWGGGKGARGDEVRFIVRLTSFKHIGLFPEQVANWEWAGAQLNRLQCFSEERRRSPLAGKDATERDSASGLSSPNILNLFGYTGIASIAAAQAGANVVHVDASKTSIAWARENARLSGVPDTSIRWMLDDALKFAKREVRRGAKYDGIILDPPAFGRGAKGEVWKIEEHLPELLETTRELLSEKAGSFFLLNGYAAGYSPLSFLQLVEEKSIFGTIKMREGEYGELRLEGGTRALSAGIFVRFVRE